jgi:mevalonate kinase
LEQENYYSNGKLLITGEYLVLHGALALAVPVSRGQEMTVSRGTEDRILRWESYYEGRCWFEARFSVPDMEILSTSDSDTANYLKNILNNARKQNKGFPGTKSSWNIRAGLGFDRKWGLGSSSSLISNIAAWFGVDPFRLFFSTQKGSGYDIACARADGPLWYRLVLGSPVSQKVSFHPPFAANLAFIYSGTKQDSSASVSKFLDKATTGNRAKQRITDIGRELPSSKSLQEFDALINEHETIMSGLLDMPKVKDVRFPDYPGSIKSLGAWGGDFLLATHEGGQQEMEHYFKSKGLSVIFPFRGFVLGT